MKPRDEVDERQDDKEPFDHLLWEKAKKRSKKVTFESLKEQLDVTIIEISREIEAEDGKQDGPEK